MTFKIGADPEFFLRDTTTGKFVNAHGMVPGTKRDPLTVEGGAVQVDGMALEFNIDPATSFDEFNGNITKVLAQLREMIPSHLEFVFTPVAHFGKEYMEAQPIESLELGCDPDYSAWLSAINPKPDGSKDFRTASGHIHIGWTDGQDIAHPDHIEACEMLTKQLDILVGLPSLMWDQDRTRRTMYGQFGAYRPKHYGVEYRTLSNIWVNDIGLRRIVYEQAMRASEHLLSGYQYYKSTNPFRIDMAAQTMGTLVQFMNDCVNQSDVLSKYISKFYMNNSRTTRPHAVEWNNKVQNDHFYNNRTFEMIHCSEVTDEMYSTGLYSTANSYLQAGRTHGYGNTLTPDEFYAADSSRRSKRSKSSRFNTVGIDTAWAALAN